MKSVFALLIAAVVLAAGTGCKMPKASKLFSLDNSWPFKDDDEPEEGVPVRIVGTWTDTVLNKQGQKPQRGFGGRIMFYGSDSEKPIKVDGQLVVYAFDETGRLETDNAPTRRYVFPAEQLHLHMSKSDMGASYSFWLPWDEAGGPKTEVSLISRFEPKGGQLITGEQTRHILPGSIAAASDSGRRQPPKLPEGVASRPARPTLESTLNAHRTDGGAQLASFESAAEPPAAALAAPTEAAPTDPVRQMSVTAITLPKNFQLPNAATPIPIPRASNTAVQTQIALAQQPQRPIQQPVASPTLQSLHSNPSAYQVQMHTAVGPVKMVPPVQPHVGTKFEPRMPTQPQASGPQYMRNVNGQPVSIPAQGTNTTISYQPAPQLPH